MADDLFTPSSSSRIDGFDWLTGFGKSALESIPELIGITPSQDTLKFRADNPVSGFLSELAGMAVPYGAWMKGIRAAEGVAGIGRVEKMAKAIEATSLERPFWAAAGAEATRLAPFEIGRVAASQVVGDRDFWDMATEAGINLGLASGVMGGIGKFASYAKTNQRLKELLPDLDVTAPLQLQLRKIDELLPSAAPEVAPKLQDFVRGIERDVRNEVPFGKERYVGKLSDGDGNKLEDLFRPKQTLSRETKFLSHSGAVDTFDSEAEWRAVLQAAGMPGDFSRYMQYPRVTQYRKLADEETGKRFALGAAKGDEKKIASSLKPVGDGWFMGREADDGMFVVARKFQGEVGKASESDRWLLFKTDSPGKFVPSQRYANAQVAREKWVAGRSTVEEAAERSAPGEFFSEALAMQRAAPLGTYMQVTKVDGPQGLRKAFADSSAVKKLSGNEFTQYVNDMVRGVMAPAAAQFRKSTRGAWVHMQGRMIQEAADTFGQKVMQGTAKLEPGKSFFNLTILPKFEGQSFQKILDSLDDAARGDFMRLVRENLTADEAAALAGTGRISNAAAQAARDFEELMGGTVFKQLNDVEHAAGRGKSAFTPGRYLPRTWDGEVYTAVLDDAGRVVGFGSGNNPRASRARAKELTEKLNVEFGRNHSSGMTFHRGASDLPQELAAYRFGPEQSGEMLRGFKWDMKEPSAKELYEAVQGEVYRITQRMAKLTRDATLQRDRHALSIEDPFAAKMVSKRFDMMDNIPGEFTKLQNKAVDMVLAPIMGRDSATKLVQGTNEAMWHLTLGAMKLSYPITNLVGNIQTVAPELAFVLGAAPERAAAYYSMVPAIAGDGLPRGAMSVLSPLRIMGQSVREMRKPGKELTGFMERAVNERVIEPKMLEMAIGEQTHALRDVRSAFSSAGNMLDATKALSAYAATWSEKVARVHAFTSGYIGGRDVLGLQGDNLYQFAKRFTERTQYLYSTADRPLVYTSPLGSSMGLFKNWMMNYVWTMGQYAHEGVRFGHWGPLMWQTAASFGIAGAAGTPIYWAADGMSKAFADKKLLQLAYDEFDSKVADGVMLGLPAALTGVSLLSSMGSPGANPVRDATQLFSLASWDRAKALGKAVGTAWDDWTVAGQHPGRDPDVRNQLMKAFAPTNFYRAMNAIQGWDTGTIRNAQGLPQITGMTTADMFLYTQGLNPVVLEKQLRVAEELYSDKQKRQNMTKVMGDTFAEAQAKNDYAGMDFVLRRSSVLGIDVSSVLRSAATRLRQEREDVVNRLGTPRVEESWRNVLSR